MKSRAAIGGHPIHTILVSFPIGLLGGSLICDAIGLISGNRKLNQTAHQMMVAGVIGGIAAAVPGAIDYMTIVPPGSEAEEIGRKHALANVGLLTLSTANAFYRAQGGSLGISTFLSAVGMGVMTYSGWLGGELVYKNKIGIENLGSDATTHVTLQPMEGLVGEFVPVCKKSDLKPGQMALALINGERIAVARLDEDRFAAFSDHCSHVGGPLSDGTLMGDRVMCPWHGSEFDVCTGAVTCGPAKDAIRSYEIRIDGENVQIKAPTVIRRSITEAGSLG